MQQTDTAWPLEKGTASNEDVVAQLRGIVGADHVLTGKAETAAFYTDWAGRTEGEALAVCLPRTTTEVSSLVADCTANGVPIVPQGGNTSSCGGSVPRPGGSGIVLSLRRMNSILKADPRDNAMIVEAGCILTDVQAAAESVDRLFPLTLGSQGSCMIGGNVATNAGGTAVLRYGNMRELVLGLEVVLADGRIWNGLRTLRKDNTGYDLRSLFIGSEGTLGVITKVALQLLPRPRSRATAMLAMRSPSATVDFLGRSQETFGSLIEAFELLSASQVQMILNHVPGNRNPFGSSYPWYALLELASTEVNAPLAQRLEAIATQALEDGLLQDALIAQSLQQQEDLWRLRHSVSESNRAHGVNFTHDVAVPIAAVPNFLERADRLIGESFPEAETSCVSHLGDGNVHYTVIFPYPAASQIANASELGCRVTRIVHDLAMALGGSFAAEHGIGQRYRELLRRYKSSIELALFDTLKATLDPKGLLNPGKVL